MTYILIEARPTENPDGWTEIGIVCPGDQPGSMTSFFRSGHRDVLVFGWGENICGVEDGPGVWLSMLGVDVEVGPGRRVDTVGLERLADLAEGPYEHETKFHEAPVAVRFSLVIEA